MDPWTVELVVVSRAGMNGGERRGISRDVERGRYHKLRQGVYVDQVEWDGAEGWEGRRQRHIVAMRALDAVSPFRPVFSHWSATVLHGLPEHGHHLDRVHTTVTDGRLRGISGVAAHLFTLGEAEVTSVGPLLVTTPARTVIDVAGASPFRGGVITADAALHRGLPRGVLEAAIELAGPRKSGGGSATPWGSRTRAPPRPPSRRPA